MKLETKNKNTKRAATKEKSRTSPGGQDTLFVRSHVRNPAYERRKKKEKAAGEGSETESEKKKKDTNTTWIIRLDEKSVAAKILPI